MADRSIHLFEVGASGYRINKTGVSGYRLNFEVNIITSSLEDALSLFNTAYMNDNTMSCIEIHRIQKRDRMTERFIVDPLLRIADKEEAATCSVCHDADPAKKVPPHICPTIF